MMLNRRIEPTRLSLILPYRTSGSTRLILTLRCKRLEKSFASSMKQVSGVKAEVDLDAAAPRLSFKYRLVLGHKTDLVVCR
jgi:hypothetical protein